MQIKARFERMEGIQMTNEAQFTQINFALTQMLQKLQTIPGSFHGVSNSKKDPNQNLFQVRSIKIDFPIFDGKNVMDWIFKIEKCF